ncbi:MAG: efflux RND transporter periplasmic adaptor subunit [Planctomycetota bacterium]|nr:efflux RND transporter periplasmic adaptor subunit [Planctomycetota bacterium]
MISLPYRCILLLGMLTVVGTVSGCGQPPPLPTFPPPAVTVDRPQVKEVVDFLEFTGSTRAQEMVTIRARVSGYLQRIEFIDGATVEKDQLLFVIEPAPFEIALASAKANLQKAVAALSLADAEVKRTEPLVRRGALSQQELDVKIANQSTAGADKAAAEAAITQAELNLSYTRVLAPISGRIGRHMVDIGNLIEAEKTVLTTIEKYSPIHAYFTVSESDVLRLMEQKRSAKPGSAGIAEVSMALPGQDGYPFRGQVDFTETGIDARTGTQQWRASFENKDGSLVPGLFVRVRLPISDPTPRLLLTDRAIGSDQRGNFVLVVKPPNAEKARIVEYRAVKLGILHDGMRVIQDGLKGDEDVVVNGLQQARPGFSVTPEDAQSEKEKQNSLSNAAGTASKGTQTPKAIPASSIQSTAQSTAVPPVVLTAPPSTDSQPQVRAEAVSSDPAEASGSALKAAVGTAKQQGDQ